MPRYEPANVKMKVRLRAHRTAPGHHASTIRGDSESDDSACQDYIENLSDEEGGVADKATAFVASSHCPVGSTLDGAFLDIACSGLPHSPSPSSPATSSHADSDTDASLGSSTSSSSHSDSSSSSGSLLSSPGPNGAGSATIGFRSAGPGTSAGQLAEGRSGRQRPWLGPSAGSRLVEQVLARPLPDGTIVEEVQTLPVRLAFPFQMRAADEARKAVAARRGTPSSQPKQKSVVKGAQGGKLLPGEKARLKAEKKTAKRAAREAARGFDVVAAAARLQEFVDQEEDMFAFEPAEKHSQGVVLKLAHAWGLKAGVQGKAGKGKAKVVVTRPDQGVTATPDIASKVAAIVSQEQGRQRKGAAEGVGLGPAGMEMRPPTPEPWRPAPSQPRSAA
ncbi:hypothetical protein V8C86DRAFT_1587272 [Haematococcus lacustris]